MVIDGVILTKKSKGRLIAYSLTGGTRVGKLRSFNETHVLITDGYTTIIRLPSEVHWAPDIPIPNSFITNPQ